MKKNKAIARVHCSVAYKLKPELKSVRVKWDDDYTVEQVADGVMLVKQRVQGTNKCPYHNYYLTDEKGGTAAQELVNQTCGKKDGRCLLWIPTF